LPVSDMSADSVERGKFCKVNLLKESFVSFKKSRHIGLNLLRSVRFVRVVGVVEKFEVNVTAEGVEGGVHTTGGVGHTNCASRSEFASGGAFGVAHLSDELTEGAGGHTKVTLVRERFDSVPKDSDDGLGF